MGYEAINPTEGGIDEKEEDTNSAIEINEIVDGALWEAPNANTSEEGSEELNTAVQEIGDIPIEANAEPNIIPEIQLVPIEQRCGVCWAERIEPTLLIPCGHTFCRVCVETVIAMTTECPMCRAYIEDCVRVYV